MFTRRQLLTSLSVFAAGGAGLLSSRRVMAQEPHQHGPEHRDEGPTTPRVTPSETSPSESVAVKPTPRVITPNGSSLPWRMENGVKVFHLIAEPVIREFAPGMTVKCWGYNGSSPGPTIEAIEGDRVRILVENRLPEHTSIHWHGILLPNGMDGVGGLNQPQIKPGETFAYEFTLIQHGTQMYHPHADEMVQIAVGMMGMFVIHPKEPEDPPIDRDYAIMLHMLAVHPGTYRPDPSVMLDFNIFTFNTRVFPGTAHMVARTNERVRIRIANLSMDEHPIHLHGHNFRVTGTDGGPVPLSAQFPETTVLVPVGATRDIEFTADYPGDWAFHCHRSHHTMNPMGHEIPNTLGVDQRGVQEKISQLLPSYMAMGERGMAEHAEHAKHMAMPENTLPMMMGDGQFGPIEMGGMFTVFKIRDKQPPGDYTDPGWYNYPQGSVAYKIS